MSPDWLLTGNPGSVAAAASVVAADADGGPANFSSSVWLIRVRLQPIVPMQDVIGFDLPSGKPARAI
jgi:hypothetical protein